ncbi:hypothetical protein [Vibrio splendidus]|uniref:hypothetical protein n=1 Tax=Vibrio splendidus TaxID=29497 RepID=UPI00021C2F2D|nr:hypothetical protein [Vibrio splendidus]EGU38046.1 hypothetical protein VISP3789_16958 [Vibrio splendidus ATCC 33789]
MNKNIIKVLSTIVTTAVLSGCVSTYEPPTDDLPTATLSFDNSTATFIQIFKNGTNCSEKVGIPSENNPFEGGNKPIKILADKEFAIHQGISFGFPTVTSCFVRTSFIPQVDQEYRAFFRSNENACVATIERFDLLSNSWVPEKSAKKRIPVLTMWEDGAFCK